MSQRKRHLQYQQERLNKKKWTRQFIFCLVLIPKVLFSQYVPFTHGIVLENGISRNYYIEGGYGFVFSNYYTKNKENEIKSKEFLLSFEQKLGYHFLNAASLRSSARLSFELGRWNSKLVTYNFGADFLHLTNFHKTGNYVIPKIGIIFYYGTFELSYGYNINLKTEENFSNSQNTFSLILRPYIFFKSMKEKWK